MTRLSDAATHYLNAIDAPGVIRDRVRHFVDLYDAILPEGELTTVFLGDQVDEDGDRHFESLWLIGPDVLAECDHIELELREDKWDLASWRSIRHIQIESRDYHMDRITSRSRLSLKWTGETGLYGSLQATGHNCEYLTQILRTFILPKVRVSGAAGAA